MIAKLIYNWRQLLRLGVRGYGVHLLRHCMVPGQSPVSHIIVRQVDLSDRKSPVNKELASADDIKLVISNWWGGGAESYIINRSKCEPATNLFVLVSPTRISGLLAIELLRAGRFIMRRHIVGMATLKHLATYHVSEIIVNQLVLWNNYVGTSGMTPEYLDRIVTELLSLKDAVRCRLTMMLHDYYAICPRITLVDEHNGYCGSEYSCQHCDLCLRCAGQCENDLYCNGVKIEEWRKSFLRLFENASEVRAFSTDTAKRISKTFPSIKPSIVPHVVQSDLRKARITQFGHLHFGVFGNMGIAKGIRAVCDLDAYLNLHPEVHGRISIFGSAKMPRLKKTVNQGSYDPCEMARIVECNAINVALFPSVWPETFSYVTHELIATNVPVICMNIGAQAESVSKYEFGEVLDELTPENIVLAAQNLVARYQAALKRF